MHMWNIDPLTVQTVNSFRNTKYDRLKCSNSNDTHFVMNKGATFPPRTMIDCNNLKNKGRTRTLNLPKHGNTNFN